MRTDRLGSILLSSLLLLSLLAPLLVSVAVTSVGTVKAATDHVVISEVYADAIDETSPNHGEFVELYNPTSSPIVMTGWKIGDNDGWEATFSGTIPAYGFFVIAIDNYKLSTDSIEAGWPTPDFNCATGPKLANSGDEVYIKDGSGNLVDVFGYGAAAENWEGSKFPTIAVQGQSYERKSGPVHDGTKGNGYDTDNNANDFLIRGDNVTTTTEAEPQNTFSPSEPPLGVSVSISPSENSGLPGEDLTYIVVIKNASEVIGNYTLTVSDNENWDPTLDDNLFLDVGPGENRATILRVHIPENAGPSTDDITVTATSQENENIWDNDACKAICYLVPQVSVSVSISPDSQAGWPGETLEYTVTVKNRGTINDNYDLVASDNAIPSWGPVLSDNLLDNVPPGENRTVTLSVTIPGGASGGSSATITVTTTSQADNGVSDSASAEAIATGLGVWIVASHSPYIGGYAVGVTGAGENIYIANSSPDRFMCYNSVDDTWQNLSVPSGLLWSPGKPGSMIGAFKNGTCMAWDNGDYLYTLFGASYTDIDDGYYRHYFYRYSIPNDNWERLENTQNPKGQGAGDAITWVPGSALGTESDWIYAIVGSDRGSSFWRYNISDDNWSAAPGGFPWSKTDDGCSLVWTGDNYLYALRGEEPDGGPACYDFWRYNIISGAWENRENIPAYPHSGGEGGVGDGGSLLWIGRGCSDYIYALSGNQCVPETIYDNRFYLYTISTDNWERLEDLPAGVGGQNGPRLSFARGSGGKIYCWRGCNGDPVLWVYLPESPLRVLVSISPGYQSGLPGGKLDYIVTVTNIWTENDNFDLKITDNENWGPSLLENRFENVRPGENRQVTLSITIPEGAAHDTRDNITVIATSQGDNTSKDSASCIARAVTLDWEGTATFTLENLYKVGLLKDLQLNTGKKLVVKFSDYSDHSENEVVIENITPPQSVVENENVPHPPGGSPPVKTAVKKAVLVLTTDNENEVISEIASFTVHQSHLKDRFIKILGLWFPNPDKHDAFKAEVRDILSQWFPAPP